MQRVVLGLRDGTWLNKVPVSSTTQLIATIFIIVLVTFIIVIVVGIVVSILSRNKG